MRKRSVTRKRSAEMTQELLIQAAIRVFNAKGFVDATVEDIIDDAGVSRGAFYIYFSNKEAVYEHVINLVVNELRTVSKTRVTQQSTKEMIRAANRGYLEAFYRHRYLMRSLFQVAAFNKDFAAKLNSMREQFISRIQRWIERGMAVGECYEMDAQAASWALGLMVEAFANVWLSMDDVANAPSFEFDTVVDTLTDLWWHSVYKPEDPAHVEPEGGS